MLLSLKRTVSAGSRAGRLATVLPLSMSFRLYGSTDKGRHGYSDAYSAHLQAIRWRSLRVLEIGVGGYASSQPGGSLRVWRDYFPRSRIAGLDVNEKSVRLGRRVSFVRGDQSDYVSLDAAVTALGGPPNVVIDDGSHLATHAQVSFEHLFPIMPSGSVYVIEDLHTSYWPDYGGGIPAPVSSAVGLLRLLLDATQANDRTFAWLPELPCPDAVVANVERVDVWPGIAVVRKA